MKGKNILKLIIAIVVSELAGVIGSFFTVPAISGWYATLMKPELAPPNWVFGPVWTSLFALMGIGAFLIWKKEGNKETKTALIVFIFQLVLNVLWSVIFFGLRNRGAACIEIIFLWLSIAGTIFFFSKISKAAAWLLAPYILWVSFAVYLNFAIWILNR